MRSSPPARTQTRAHAHQPPDRGGPRGAPGLAGRPRRGYGATVEPRDRYDPLPSFAALPAYLLGARSRRALVRVSLAIAAVAAIAIGAFAWSSARQAEQDREAEAALRAGRARALAVEQAPRSASRPAVAGATPAVAGAALEAAVGRDARGRVRAGALAGPVEQTTCTLIERGPAAPTRAAASYSCLAELTRAQLSERYGSKTLVSGHRFRARADLAAGTLTWCKENPRPLHPDTEEFVTVPLSRACTG